MATMYELIMDLPLFKGVGKDHISLFLEKTNIGFQNYESGERIVETGDVVRMVRFIISGEVRIIHRLEEASLTVEERCGFGKVLGADRLFGMETGYPYDAVAVGKTSIMEFSKEQYINLLHSDNIYMLNFFNYLSLRAQRPVDCLRHYCHGGVGARIKELICVLTDPGAKDIVISGSKYALGEFCGTIEEDVQEWKEEIVECGVAECCGNKVRILSRRRFLDL
ncbi:MAG: cyclic nucleotide-binding domain-containing protein [Muribaculaceae bacterium]|nr:cyclic nucleotide-binding domain-containing protein [Muribaculaceae bacterium]